MAPKMPVDRLFDNPESVTLFTDQDRAVKRLLTEIWHANGQVSTSMIFFLRRGPGRPKRKDVQRELTRLKGLIEAWMIATGRWTAGAGATDQYIQASAHGILGINLKQIQVDLDSR